MVLWTGFSITSTLQRSGSLVAALRMDFLESKLSPDCSFRPEYRNLLVITISEFLKRLLGFCKFELRFKTERARSLQFLLDRFFLQRFFLKRFFRSLLLPSSSGRRFGFCSLFPPFLFSCLRFITSESKELDLCNFPLHTFFRAVTVFKGENVSHCLLVFLWLCRFAEGADA